MTTLFRRGVFRRRGSSGLTTWNFVDRNPAIALSGGNLIATSTSGLTSDQVVRATNAGISGRFFELVFTTLTTTDPVHGSGFALSASSQPLSSYPGSPDSIAIFRNGYYEGPGSAGFLSGVAINQGDVVGVRLNAASADFFQNGALIKTFTALPSGLLYPAVDLIYSDSVNANFGASAFSFPPSTTSASAWIATWNASDKNGNVALSAGDLTATLTNSSDGLVRGTTTRSANRFFEVSVGVNGYAGSGPAMIVGLANSAQSTATWLGQDSTNGIGYGASGVVFGTGGGSFGVIGGTGVSYGLDVIGVELLTSTANVYKNGALIYTFTALPSGALYPAVSLANLNDSVTGNFAGPFSFPPSGGVTGWNG